jgi:hypothetical protein
MFSLVESRKFFVVFLRGGCFAECSAAEVVVFSCFSVISLFGMGFTLVNGLYLMMASS